MIFDPEPHARNLLKAAKFEDLALIKGLVMAIWLEGKIAGQREIMDIVAPKRPVANNQGEGNE
jgi:hypothetical protein